MRSTFISTPPANFFEPISYHSLAHRAGKFNVDSTQFYVFNHDDQFRGFKSAYSQGYPPFFLYHREVFDGACQIFKNLFGHEPDLLRFFSNEQKTWNAFLVTSQQVAKFDYEITEDLFGEKQLRQSLDKKDRQPFRHFPLIGGFNDYAYEQNPAFFYLIATPFRQTTASFLTVDNFRFLQDLDKRPFTEPGINRAALLQSTCQRVTVSFRKERDKFEKLLTEMASNRIKTDYFAPVVLDLYNRNRNTESVRNDDTLRASLRYLYQQADNFSYGQSSLLWSDFIHFIIRHNEFNLDQDWLLKRIEELFAEKRSYKKFNDLFTKFLGDNARYNRYVIDQLTDWDRVRQIL